MEEGVKIVPALCTQCGGRVEVDPKSEKAECPFCGASFIVEKAVTNYNVQHATIEHADNVNIDVSGSVKTVLDFVGEQMKESREIRREARKEAAEQSRMMTKNFLKLFGIIFAVMIVMSIAMFVYYQITDPDEAGGFQTLEEYYSDDHVISCYIDGDGMLSVNITDPGLSEWYYDAENSTERLKNSDSDFDGFHFTVKPGHDSGIGYAVVTEYEEDDLNAEYPHSYGVVEFTIEAGEVTEIQSITHDTDLQL